MQTSICKHCKAVISYQIPEGFTFDLKPTRCDACDIKIRAEEDKLARATRHSAWRVLCPDIYVDTDVNHPDMPQASKLSKIMTWKFGPKGLIVIGPSRKGKTRSMWLLVRKLMVEDRKNVIAMTSAEFACQAATAWSVGAATAAAWLKELAGVDVLFIDDLGKFKLTERVECDLLDVIDRRTSGGLPLLLTSNFVGDALKEKLSGDRGEPIIERIREFCSCIKIV